jgi:hypothetical protein
MWVNTDNNAWVEAGLTDGEIAGTNHGLAFFWAEQNTVGSYAEHYVQNISLSTDYNTKVSFSGSGSTGAWSVYLNGTSKGTSSANHASSVNNFQLGAELETNDAQVTATGTNLQKRASDNTTWSYNWGAGVFLQNSPASAGWTTSGSSFWDSAN